MWKEGSIKVYGEIFHYWMKQYDEGSERGIDGGRISKLMLKRDGKIVYNLMEYDFTVDASSGAVTEWGVESIFD